MAEDHRLARQLADILDECRHSHAVHPRKLKELAALRSSESPVRFFPSFIRALKPLFGFPRRTPSSERVVRFVATFAARRGGRDAAGADAFVEEFLRFLLIGANASHRSTRFRSCHIISEIIMRLPDDAEVSDEVWDDVIENMKQRLDDKVATIRGFAVCALSRFACDGENTDIIELLAKNLSQEQNAGVRKLIVLSLPASNVTSSSVVSSTLDVSELVRKAAYSVLSCKFPLQSLSIKLRTAILQRGLSDRSPLVVRECFKMLKEEWLVKCCGQDPLALLRCLDVETYETIGEAVMDALLKDGLVQIPEGHSIRNHFSKPDGSEEKCLSGLKLMGPEESLYWRTLCKHLQDEAHVKGSDAANTSGTEAAVYASEATEKNDLLDAVLPETVSDYVELVRAHILAGSTHRFASRQLLILGANLDFSDSIHRKVASSFVQELLLRPLECEVDGSGNKIVIGDGISVGGDRDWAMAVAGLAKKVYVGEFEAALSSVLKELAQPCRERSADFVQWLHCLAVAALLLENIESLRHLKGTAMEPEELLHSLLLPAAKQVHQDVQRAATRCLSLYGMLQRRPGEDIVKQLRLLFVTGPVQVRIMASKALFDLATWHGPQEVDTATGLDPQESKTDAIELCLMDLNLENTANIGVINLLYAAMVKDASLANQAEEEECLHSILAEGFAKMLLWSGQYPSMPHCMHTSFLSRLITLYFSDETKELQRLTQCLSVFFDHYPALSPNHKRCVSRAFVPVMRSMWPGVYGNPGGSPALVSKTRRLAAQAARFMLQMMQVPMISKEFDDEHHTEKSPESHSESLEPKLEIDCTEEGLAIRIAAEVLGFTDKKAAAGKAYVSALCRVAVLVQFRAAEQEAIKCMRALLQGMMSSLSADKELVKELNLMAGRLASLDLRPGQEMPQEQAAAILERLELGKNLADLVAMPPSTPSQQSARPPPARRRARREVDIDDDGDDEAYPAVSVAAASPSLASTRSQRASKTAAMRKLTSRSSSEEFEDVDGEGSDLTSEFDSGEVSDALEGY